jgi:hypothetical protein
MKYINRIPGFTADITTDRFYFENKNLQNGFYTNSSLVIPAQSSIYGCRICDIRCRRCFRTGSPWDCNNCYNCILRYCRPPIDPGL